MKPLRLAARYASAAVLLMSAATRASAQLSGVLIGDVVARETGAPLDHAMVSIAGERQTFTSESGVFSFRGLQPGVYRMHVTHLGFAPADQNIEIPASGPIPRVKVMLTHLSFKLAAVRVIAKPSCTNPGRPDPTAEPDFAAIVQQIRMNAEHYQLLSDSFPFAHRVERIHQMVRRDSVRSRPEIDTVSMRSDAHGWEYEMGTVVERDPRRGYVMHLPTLRDFAGIQFLNNHCFQYAGIETSNEGNLIRIDFRADDQIKKPDVNGSIYLDSATYQIRRADLELSRMIPQVPEITSVHVRTIFTEVAPSIVIIDKVVGSNSLKHGWGPWATVASREEQRMTAFSWMRTDPRHPVQP